MAPVDFKSRMAIAGLPSESIFMNSSEILPGVRISILGTIAHMASKVSGAISQPKRAAKRIHLRIRRGSSSNFAIGSDGVRIICSRISSRPLPVMSMISPVEIF